jgi:CheY-like chemotaxis protein
MLNSSAQLLRILVVDDDPATLRLVKDQLDRTGFEVFILPGCGPSKAYLKILQRRLSRCRIAGRGNPVSGFWDRF